jgi:ubiquinone/menaquinone biosynthesis C-methylase UbiE
MGIYGRVFAALYDVWFEPTERAGLAARRAALLGEARGRVLEIGAGTGLNLPHYPPAVEELVLAEPAAPMAARLRGKLDRTGRAGEVIEAPAERLPFPDSAFDTVVATLVLCTVKDPAAALGEVRRVLRPGGRFLFLEHVRSEKKNLARWQDRLAPLWTRFGHGCHPNRDTAETLAASPLEVLRLERDEIPRMPALVRPLIIGRAGHSLAP